MKIAVISDTHTYHRNIANFPEAEIFIHCGDMTSGGSIQDLASFTSWLTRIPYGQPVICAGNHDFCFEDGHQVLARELVRGAGGVYLQNDFVKIHDHLIYATPEQPRFFDWAFNRTEEQLEKAYARIPPETTILVTHAPPFGILDEAPGHQGKRGTLEKTGSKALLARVKELKQLKLHVFGHIHEHGGCTKYMADVKFFNASMKYVTSKSPYIVEI